MGLHTGSQQRFVYPNGDEVSLPWPSSSQWEGSLRPGGTEGTDLCLAENRTPDNLVPIHAETLVDLERAGTIPLLRAAPAMKTRHIFGPVSPGASDAPWAWTSFRTRLHL